MPVINPRSGLADYEIPVHDDVYVAGVADQLRLAQTDWAEAGLAHRCEVFKRWRDAIRDNATAISEALCIDTGRKLMASIETKYIMDNIDHWVKRAPEIIESQARGQSGFVPSVDYQYHLVPYPVAGVISPWNVPLILSMIDTMPALIAGSAVLLKPSEITPRYAAPLQASIDAVPELAEVLKIVTGGAETGMALIDNVDVVCFTGSVITGQKVAAQAAQNFIPAFLELGGKDPAIVLASANIDQAATAILRSAAGMTGQACQSLERTYVHRSVMDQFLISLVAKASEVSINWPDIGSGHMGPFIFQPQAAKVQEQIHDAVARGAMVHCGGTVSNHDGGYWCLPTVLTGVDHSMMIMQEETFGPLLPVIPFDDTDEAVRLANDSEFGLSAAVFAGSREEGESVGRRIKAGAISINDAGLTAAVHDVEKNAFCKSGMGGSRMGDAGLMRFFRKQALMYQNAPPVPLDSLNESVPFEI